MTTAAVTVPELAEDPYSRSTHLPIRIRSSADSERLGLPPGCRSTECMRLAGMLRCERFSRTTRRSSREQA